MSVLVSGATGFIAQYIVQDLLDKNYKVIGSVRSQAKGDDLKVRFGENFSYEVVPDISIEGAFDDALKAHPDIKVFVHTASPVILFPENPDDVLKPAIDGTKYAMLSAKNFGPQIERFVVTSSGFAIYAPGIHDTDPSSRFTEDFWNDVPIETLINNYGAYAASKLLAEQSAWEFVETEKPNFSLATIVAPYVLGPQLFEDQVGDTLISSNEFVRLWANSKLDQEYLKIYGPSVDVRDVSTAHLAAFEKDEFKGKRLVVSEGYFTEQTILDILNENFPTLKGNMAVGTPGSDVELLSKVGKLDNTQTNKILGINYIGLKQSVIGTIQQYLDCQEKKSAN